MKTCSDNERQAWILEHPEWAFSPDRGGLIRRTFKFGSFVSAFAFMARMAEYSERVQHHPEWFNVYNRVEVTLTTHDVGGLSDKDLAWAQEADRQYLTEQP
jgi:4a-hydroxytetrahydrobiopterin dehydratase